MHHWPLCENMLSQFSASGLAICIIAVDSARCDVESSLMGRRRGGRRRQHTVVKVMEAMRTFPSTDWDAIPSHGIVLEFRIAAIERLERSSNL